jgi:predicted aspartyl protease
MKRLARLFALILLTGCVSKPVTPQAQAPVPAPLASEIPFVLHDNRLLVNVMLNGQGPFVMIFDTGGANAMTPEAQRLLDLKSQGPEFASGAGEATVKAGSVHVKSMQFGALRLEDQKFLVLNLKSIRKTFAFPHLDGVIGYEVLKNARVRIDFDRQMIQLVPENAAPLSAAQTLGFDFIDDKPLIDGKINGRPARILIDTGDRSNLTLFRKFAALSGLQEEFKGEKTKTQITGLGLGGPIRGRVAQLAAVELGAQELRDVTARLPLTRKGYFFRDGISASAGTGLLQAFNVEFDYKNKRLALQRRKDFAGEFEFVPVKFKKFD